MTCTHCNLRGCPCLFTPQSKAARGPVCLKCAGAATLEKRAEIDALQKAQGIMHKNPA